MPVAKKRDTGGFGELGPKRYRRFCDAFDRVQSASAAGYHLEAITILESILWDRLSSRLHFVAGEDVSSKRTFGDLCTLLGPDPVVESEHTAKSKKNGKKAHEKHEKDADFIKVIGEIDLWRKQRNETLHEAAKIFSRNEKEVKFSEWLALNQKVVDQGILVLRAFDRLDTISRSDKDKKPATYPDAFYPEDRVRRERT